jgi:hypothetical protein
MDVHDGHVINVASAPPPLMLPPPPLLTTTTTATSTTTVNNHHCHCHTHCHVDKCHWPPQMHQAQTMQGVVWALGNFLFLFLFCFFSFQLTVVFIASTYAIYHKMGRGMAGTIIGNKNRAQETSMMSLGL